MFKPIQAARSNGRFKSIDELARHLRKTASDLDWPEARALAVKVGDIDRGDKVWWTRRRNHALALASLLEVPLVDLGLHDTSSTDRVEFATFPELPPFIPAQEKSCDIGFAARVGRAQEEEVLAFWISPVPPAHAWRGPDDAVSWLQFKPGSGLDFFWTVLCARTHHEHMTVTRLRDAGEHLRQPGSLILRVEQPCEDLDLVALGYAHRDLKLLLVASFGAPAINHDGPFTWLPTWNILTGQADARVAALTDPHESLNPIARYEWHLHENWQDRLLDWVEKRIGHATGDTLFTARGVSNWLSSFPDGWQFMRGPADLLAICRLCHLSRETALPRAGDADAGQRLLKRVSGTDTVTARRFTMLISERLETRQLRWSGSLPAEEWTSLAALSTTAPDEAALLAIANGASKSVRQERARSLSAHLLETSVAPFVSAGLLVATGCGELWLTPRFLVDLVARDQLMQIIRTQAVERWALYCHDDERRPLVDAALSSLAIEDLLAVLGRIEAMPHGALAARGASEALFVEIGKRICDVESVSTAFAPLARMVLPRLSMEDFAPRPWTRPVEDKVASLEWDMACWAWSLWCDTAPIDVPDNWTWWFPGWALERAAIDKPCFWSIELPEESVTSRNWRRVTTLAARLGRRFARPPQHPPTLLKPMLVIEGTRGRWPVEASWLDDIIGHMGTQPSSPAETLLLEHLEQEGSAAAARLLPALIDYQLSASNDSIRHFLFYRSRIRTWVMQNVSLADAIACLTDRQLETLWQVPHALPAHLLLGMLQNPDEGEPRQHALRANAVQALDANHIDTLTALLATETLGTHAAHRLWTVAPQAAERVLRDDSGLIPPHALRLLMLAAPIARTGVVAGTILSGRAPLSEDERQNWAKQRLPDAGAHAEALGRILGFE